MFQKARDILTLVIAVLVETFFKDFIGCCQVVIIDDFIRKISELDMNVIGWEEWCHEIEIGHVHGHELWSGGGNEAIE